MSKIRSRRRVHLRAGYPDTVAAAAAAAKAATAERAAMLARLADHQLHLGYHQAAERLAHEAEALRQTGGDRQPQQVPR